MAGLTGYRDISTGLAKQFLTAQQDVKRDAQEAALEAAVEGQAMMEHIIDTTESSLSPGKENRNWTFNMRNSLDSKVARSGNTISIRAGWLGNKESYFLIQNDGGDLHRGSSTVTITPMNALMAGHDEMLRTLSRWGLKIQ